MTDQQFDRDLGRRLREHAEYGVRPYDAMEIARLAMASGGRAGERGARVAKRMPVWFRSLVLAGLLVVLLVAAAFVGGLVELPNPVVLPTPSASALAEVTPSPRLTFVPAPTGDPLPTDLPGPTPSGLPTVPPTSAPSFAPTAMPTTPVASPTQPPLPSASPVTTPSPEPTASPEPTPATAWQELTDFPASGRVGINAAAHGAAGYVMVAVASGGGNSWVSPDGTNWTRSTDSGFDGASHVVANGGEYIAIGPDRAGAGRGVWRSTDGLNWSLLTATPVLEFVNDLTVENGVLIAVGASADFDAARIWTSEDGVNWFSIGAPETSSELTAVAARGGDIAVLGDDSSGYGRVIHFRPTHTSEWVRHLPFGEDRDGRLVDLVTNGQRFVAIGYEDDFDTGVRRPTVRSSTDGTNWVATQVNGTGVDVFEQVVVLPDGRFATIGSSRGYSGSGSRLTMREVAYSYVSADGAGWGDGLQIWDRTQQVGSAIGDQVERYRAVAAGSAGVVIGDEWQNSAHVFFAPADSFR